MIAFESLSDTQLEIIEIIRRALAAGLESGRIRAVNSYEPEDKIPFNTHPTLNVLRLGDNVDACVVDDRAINRHFSVSIEGKQKPILSTLDLLDDLANKAAISQDDLFAHRTYLRQAGYQLVPITHEELSYHLGNALFADGALVETAELRAIRESLLKSRMSKLLQISTEAPWLQRSMIAVVRTIKRLWQVEMDRSEIDGRAEWLLGLLDVRGWAGSAPAGSQKDFALYSYASQVLILTTPPDAVSNEVREFLLPVAG